MQRISSPLLRAGIARAQERHLAVVIRGIASQQVEQQEAVRARHGSSLAQTAQLACRTNRAVSRPTNDSVSSSPLSTAHIVPARRSLKMKLASSSQRRVRLNHPNRSLIVPAMIKSFIRLSLFVLLPLVSALPALAQSTEFGVLYGGSMYHNQNDDSGLSTSFRFSNHVKEAYYGIETDPGTWFRLKIGEIDGPTAFRFNTSDASGNNFRAVVSDPQGKVEHVDGLVDYRFSEPFGSTSIFGGVGYYRVKGTVTHSNVPSFPNPLPPADERSRSESAVGAQLGVHGDFPLSRRYGVIVEGAYHWINTSVRNRYITATAGLRISF